MCRAVGAPGSWQASQAWGLRVGRLVGGIGVASKHVTKGITIMARRLRALVLDVRVACRPGLGLAPGRRGVSGYLLTRRGTPSVLPWGGNLWDLGGRGVRKQAHWPLGATTILGYKVMKMYRV